MMFVQTPTQFYVLRFLLGAFEAGFFPGIILYLTYWYPVGTARPDDRDLHGGSTIALSDRRTAVRRIMKYMDGATAGYRAGSGCSSCRACPHR